MTFDPKDKAAAAPATDPWNYWIFSLGANGSVEGQESDNEKQISVELSADRTTAAWKLDFNAEGEFGKESFVLEDDETFTASSRNIEANALAAKSLTDHWSAAAVGALPVEHLQQLRSPPAARRRHRVRRLPLLRVDAAHSDADVHRRRGTRRLPRKPRSSVKDDESLMDHRFETTLGLQQPWGSASASFEMVQYLTQTDKYRLSTFGSVEVRLFKGFSVEFSGEASRRRDQLSLRRGDATNEEILVRQRELATGYEYDFGFGISYSFGSIFNNVVNPRFRNAGGF